MSQTKTNAQIAFGKAIKELRDKSELSQEDLALDAKMDRTYISGIERGVRNVSLLNIVRIAKALHLKVSELFLKAGL